MYKRKKGGAVIDSGAYGCVIKPNIECNEYLSSDKYITKLIDKQNEKGEFGIIDILGLKNFRDFNKYIIIPLKSCSLNNGYNQIDIDNIKDRYRNDIDNCIQRLDDLKTMDNAVNIISEYGGKSFHFYRESSPFDSFINMIPYYCHLFECIIFLNNNGISHRDIKPGNILIDKDNKKIRLIDFGISAFIDDNKNISNKEYITINFREDEKIGSYVIWPVEMYIFSNLYRNSDNRLLYITEEYVRSSMNTYLDMWLPLNEKYRYFDIVVDECNKINDDIASNKYNIYEWKKIANERLDVFSLGSVLMMEYKYLYNNANKNDITIMNDIKEFIFSNMLCIDCRKRGSIMECYNKFKEICNKYKINMVL
jgi:hypothetical protein